MFRFNEEFEKIVSKEFLESTKDIFDELQSKGAIAYYESVITFDSGIKMPSFIFVECPTNVFTIIFELHKLMFKLSGSEDEDYAPGVLQVPADILAANTGNGELHSIF